MNLPGQQLEALCELTQHNLLLVAPFVKANTLESVLARVSANVNVQCVTRWRPDEIAAGVSDLEIWPILKSRANCTLWLRSDLHAKYYRGDHKCLVGSANLTNAALGWSNRPNLELLVSVNAMPEFEQQLLDGSVLVDDSIYAHMRKVVETLPNIPLRHMVDDAVIQRCNEEDHHITTIEMWLPILRHPEKFYAAYIGDLDQLGSGSQMAALRDLQVLDPPNGLDKEQFEAYIGTLLLQQPLIRQIDQFVKTPQRFGAVRDFLRTLPCASQEGFIADMAWQTTMRWLLRFLPERYVQWVDRHTEMFARRSF